MNIELRRVHSNNFFYKFKTSKLRKLMRRINSFFVLCSCRACVETGRNLVEPVSTPGSVCSFTPYWEELLRIYDISFEFRRRVGAPIDETKNPMGATMLCSVAIVNVSPLFIYLVWISPDFPACQIGPDPFWRQVAYGFPITEAGMSFRDGHSEMRRRLARLFDFVEDSQLNGEEPAPRDDESDEGTMSVTPDSDAMSPSQRASVSDHTSPREISEEF